MEKKIDLWVSSQPALKKLMMELNIAILIIMVSVSNVMSGASGTEYQQKQITGIVTEKDGTPIPGVNVIATGTTQGTITDIAGKYSLEITPGAISLTFSFIGMEPQTISIGTLTQINVTMSESDIGLEEVVVIGYGTQRKRDVTAALTTIDVTRLKDVPASNLTRLLQGQASGVQIKQTTGRPGLEFEVIIRGLGSLGAGSQPLYVIDGFPIGTSAGNNLNANDIATITILKDAVSTAIYGARGSNGVVLITTKNAKSGEANISFTASYGIQNIPESRKTKVLNGPQFAQFKKDIFMDKILYFEQREPAIDEVPLDYRYPEQTTTSTNWFEAILNQNAAFQNYNISLSQGKGNIRSLVSIGYIGQEGALIGTNYDNYSIRANVEGKITNFLNMGLNVNASIVNEKYATTEGRDQVVGAALLMDPREPIYNEDGTYNAYIGGHDGIFGWANPVMKLLESSGKSQTSQVLSNAFLEFSFLKNFKFKTVVNARLRQGLSKSYVPSTMAATNAPPPRDATENDGYAGSLNISADQLLTYANSFGNHNLSAMLGFTAQEEINKGLSGSGTKFPNDLTPFLNSATIKSSGSSENGWSTEAFFSRISYSFKDKYLFSGTFRREGSSRFGSKNKYGNFPAVSVGWRISEESFIPEYSWLNDFKVRASWGMTGNNNIGNYSSLAFMNLSNYIVGNSFSSGYVVGSFPNTDLGWEKSNQLDIGFDVSVFDNKLTFSAEYYDKITSDMLLSIQLPAISGFTSSLGNVGKVRNHGFEFTTGFRTRINELGFLSNFNISFNRNEVLEIRGENDALWSGDLYGQYNVSKPGRPIGMIYGFRVLGIFQNQEEIDASPEQGGAIPGVYKYFDGDGDGVISYDTKDMVEIGNPWPKFTWGLTLGGDYKKFDLNILFTGAYRYDVMKQMEKSTVNNDGVFNVLTENLNRWRSEENLGNGKLATTNGWKYERESNSRYIYDASNIWIKDITFGYTFPKSKHISGARVYIRADNFFVITYYPGNNPDANTIGGINPGMDDETYPIARTVSIGANLTF